MLDKIKVIIQSRLTSSRLPAKAVLHIGGLPAIVLCALRAANTGLDIVVATSDDCSDDIIEGILSDYNIKCYRGPLDNVLLRYELASKELSPDSIIVRLTADNLFPDGSFVEELVNTLKSKNLDYLGTSSPMDCLPYGLSAEAFKVKVLREAVNQTTSQFEREHVTPEIIKKYSKEIFKPLNFKGNYSNLRCTIDTVDDYLTVSKIFKNEKDAIAVPWNVLCEKLANIKKESLSVPLQLKNDKLYSKFTLGTAQLGLKYGAANVSGKPHYDQAKAIVNEAVKRGVRSIDCARAYGDAEIIVGDALKNGLIHNVDIITKLDPLENISTCLGESDLIRLVEHSVYKSLINLKTNVINTLLLHRWEHYQNNNGFIWRRLLKIKEEGLINNLGVSVYNPQEALIALNDENISHIQIPFNILDHRWKHFKISYYAEKRKDVVFHARSVLLQGILCAEEAFWPNINNLDKKVLIDKINYLTKKFNRKNKTDLCLSYVRSQPWITSIVLGQETMNQLEENIALFNNPLLSDDECLFIEEYLTDIPENLLNPSIWNV